MHTPAPAAWLLLLLGALSGSYCLLRMRLGAPGRRRGAGGEALMGFGTATMAVPPAVLALPRTAWLIGAALFGANALQALWHTRRTRRPAHHLHHAVGATAMVHMSIAMADGHEARAAPLLTGALLGYFVLYVLAAGARLAPIPPGPAAPADTGGGTERTGWALGPEAFRTCRIAMGLAMCAMLLTL
ncbi:DUF5134 domain-containing protein [Streptomyces sp. NPDC002454]